MNKKHLLIFISILLMAYGPIFLRVENWPFTDWRVFAWSYHPDKVYVFSLNLKHGAHGTEVERGYLSKVGFSPTKFNLFVYRSYVKSELEEIKKYIQGISEQAASREVLKSVSCPCKLVLVVKKPKSNTAQSNFQIEEEELVEYDIQAL